MLTDFVIMFGLGMKPKIKKPTLKETQEAKSWPIWEKKESTFPWEYDEQETRLILKGKAVIKTADGNVEFEAGDTSFFLPVLSARGKLKTK